MCNAVQSLDLLTSHTVRSFTGSDIKGNTIMPETDISNSYEDPSSYFFEKYSKDLLVEVKDISGRQAQLGHSLSHLCWGFHVRL